MKNKLSIIIPCKNEEKYIGKLLHILSESNLIDTDIIVADAGSTDKTLDIIDNYKNRLNIKVVDGGLPSVGRNNGAKHSDSKYILFIDADITIKDRYLIVKNLYTIDKFNLDLITTNIKCINSNKTNIIYFFNNVLQKLSKLHKPFATGMFMLFRKETFDKIGGFNEDSVYAEDYELSRKINNQKFKICGTVYSDDRRFQKMGYLKIIKMFLRVMFSNKQNVFKKGIEYWD